jgi:hypothetical protein
MTLDVATPSPLHTYYPILRLAVSIGLQLFGTSIVAVAQGGHITDQARLLAKDFLSK